MNEFKIISGTAEQCEKILNELGGKYYVNPMQMGVDKGLITILIMLNPRLV